MDDGALIRSGPLMTCIFCDIAGGRASCHVLSEDDWILAILSLEGHPLVLPRAHVPDLASLDAATGAATMRMATCMAAALRVSTECAGVNLVLSDGAAAGQDVPHLHMHVKPRWRGDGVALAWDTGTMVEAQRTARAAALRTALAIT